jgi:hypothetical protein
MKLKFPFISRNEGEKNCKHPFILNLRSGEMVEVRQEQEILSTLNSDGTLEGLPFTVEMKKYCGRRFEVLKPVNKLIVEITGMGMRRIRDVVILKGVFCDGASSHLGCSRTCPLLWKEAWLKRSASSKET